MADSSSDESIDDSHSLALPNDTSDLTQRRLAYFHSQRPTSAQSDRYELFHKFTFLPPQPELKSRHDRFIKLIGGMVGGKGGSEQVKLALATAAKMFVVKLVEKSVEVASERQDGRGPLLPEHIEEAKRRMTKRKKDILG